MKRLGIRSALILISMFGFSAAAIAQPHERMADRKISIKMKNEPLGKVFDHLIHNMGIPIGFEKSMLDHEQEDFTFQTIRGIFRPPRKQDEPETYGRGNHGPMGRVYRPENYFITVDFENTPLKHVFDSIVRQMSNYDWEISDEVINIFPKRGRDPRLVNFLAINVAEYHLIEGTRMDSIRYRIRILPEVVSFLKENDLAIFPWHMGGEELKFLTTAGVEGRNLNLKQLLNRLATMKKGGWIVKFDRRKTKEGHEVIEIDI